jgi:DNA-binding Lrp family transcriptional regulator
MIDEKSYQLICALRQDSRRPLTQISKLTGLPVTTLFEKLKHLKKNNTIRPCALIDFRELGFEIQALIMLKVPSDFRQQMVAHLKAHSQVNSLFRLANEYDLMVEGVFRTINECNCFKEKLERTFHISEFKVCYAVENLQREGFLA